MRRENETNHETKPSNHERPPLQLANPGVTITRVERESGMKMPGEARFAWVATWKRADGYEKRQVVFVFHGENEETRRVDLEKACLRLIAKESSD